MTDSERPKATLVRKMPRWLVAVPLIYLTLLVVDVIVHGKTGSIGIFGLIVPMPVIWFGTLGGVVDSLQGIFFRNRHWDPGYTIWHFFAGITGAAYGLVSYLFLLVIVNSAGAATPATAVFALAAFTIGYEQGKFHSLMDEVFTVIFRPNKSPDALEKSVKP